MKRSFYTVDGEIIGESTGSSVINYATDALGSVTGTLVGGQLVNTYAYKPYGALLAKTGTGADPSMRWLGGPGYRPTGRSQSDYYVRARHYSVAPGIWTTTDPLWPGEASYGYKSQRPTTGADPSGLYMDYVRVRSRNHPSGVTAVYGSITLPWGCDAFCTYNNPNDYLNFWLSLAVSDSPTTGTAVDCGISFTCGTKPGRGSGWYVNMKVHGVDLPNNAPCGVCGPGKTVQVILYYYRGRAYCIAGDAPQLSARTEPGHWVAGMAMGVGFDGRLPCWDGPCHTTASWRDLHIMRGSRNWQPWDDPRDATDPQKPGGSLYTVIQAFPLAAYRGWPFEGCDCPWPHPIRRIL